MCAYSVTAANANINWYSLAIFTRDTCELSDDDVILMLLLDLALSVPLCWLALYDSVAAILVLPLILRRTRLLLRLDTGGDIAQCGLRRSLSRLSTMEAAAGDGMT